MGSNYLSVDSDGDGVTDGQELQDGTGINDERSLVRTHQTITSSLALWDQKDFDGDGILNGFEINVDSGIKTRLRISWMRMMMEMD